MRKPWLPHFRICWLKSKSMKIRRTHRRKLRFSSAKDVATTATAKAQYASKHCTRHPNGLPATTWSNIQERFIAAKSLGEITRTTLQFFKEHEDRQGSETGAVFPISVPASEIYKMKVPRKRRIYDVLHVLEGIGMIKRARWNADRKTKGGYFLYYGKAAMFQHLAAMKAKSVQLMLNFRQSCASRATNVVEEDSVLVKAFEDLAIVERWPCLVTTTVCFLALLFQQDYQVVVALPGMSDRLIGAKKFLGASAPGSVHTGEITYNDVQRRMYDVVSVLIGCNLILTSFSPEKALESPLRSTDKSYQRKHIRFNNDIFTDLRHHETLQSSKHIRLFVELSNSKVNTCGKSSIVSPPSMCLQKLDRNVDIGASPKFPTKYVPEAPNTVRVQDLFSPLGKQAPAKNEWCDESLTQLGLYDALPRQDQIDWELNKQFKDIYREMWGRCSASVSPAARSEMLPHGFRIDQVDVKLVDIDCHEELADGKDYMTTNFLF